jgi:hypothetical protein
VNLFSGFKNLALRGINALAGRAFHILHPVRKPKSPLADRLLADALRLAELPSPTVQEEQRAEFILERLSILGINPLIDTWGNIRFRLHAPALVNEPPLLLFADLGSCRWHPVESFSRLDAETAQGAALADALGPAALLSLAEAAAGGRLRYRRDLLFLFAAGSPNASDERPFKALAEDPLNRPFAALALRGLTLGSLVTRMRGIYRMEIGFSLERRDESAQDPGNSGKDGPDEALDQTGPVPSNAVVNGMLITGQTLLRITWDTQDTTRLYIRRIEAGAAFGKTPVEGLLEIELESSDGAQLDRALRRAQAAAGQAASAPGLRAQARTVSAIPVGDPALNQELIKTVFTLLKEQRIKIQEENGPDRSALLSIQGVPALSLGIALGREGRIRDTIEIASIERGRVFLETLITRLTWTVNR